MRKISNKGALMAPTQLGWSQILPQIDNVSLSELEGLTTKGINASTTLNMTIVN